MARLTDHTILNVHRVVIALLGLVLIVDTLVNQFRVVEFTVGLVMLGLLPIDAVADAIASHCAPYREQ